MTFLFWNLRGRQLELRPVVARLVSLHRVDVVLLAECPTPQLLLPSLNAGGEPEFFPCSNEDDSVAVYTRFSHGFVVPQERQRRYTIWRLALPARKEILLVTAHLGSKRHLGPTDKTGECRDFAEAIRAAEENACHSKTLIVGDLNLNPFEDGVVVASGLNAVMTRRLAARGTRTVGSRKRRFFYNPMWRFFGDRGQCPPGTYYFRSSKDLCYFWNIFDQVLVRPDLMGAFGDRALRILDSDGATSFLNENGVPDSRRFSDHLPIVFALRL